MELHEQQEFQVNKSDSDGDNDNQNNTVDEPPSIASGGPQLGELSPSKAAHELVKKTMMACFVDCSSTEREQLIRDVQRLSRTFAKRLLLPPDENTEQEDSQSQYVLPRDLVVPPSAYFSFRDNGRMHLPIVDWSAFRGYSVAVWINVEFCLAQAKKESSAEDLYAKFNLFRFTNGSNTLGVEASLEYTEDSTGSGHGVLINVSCCAPGAADAKKSASVAATSSYEPEWRRIQRQIDVLPGKWHLLVVSHSLHYVKKSKVTCHVDTKLQFKEELVYPSGLVTASKCTVGGGRNVKAKVASVAMYQEELSRGTIELMYSLGPMVSSFNRWAAALPTRSSRMVAGTRERLLGPSPLTVPESDSFAAFCKLQVVFAFNAQNTVNEDYADLGVEWLCEGTTPTTNGKWLALESTVSASAEIQQRNARLGKSTQKMIFPEYHAAWYRSVGVSSLPVILDYLLTACEKITRKQDAAETEQSGERPLSAVVESVVVDLLWILKGMLLSNVANQQEVLGNYVFHMLSHVMVRHKDCLSVIWTPGSLVVCVEMVKSLFDVMPSPKKSLDVGENHPFHVSIWTTNPLFASGVRAILLDYRLWTQADFKTQSIYNHQMYGLACEYPRAFNNMQAVSKVLEILGRFYSQITEPDDKDHHWKQQSIQSLVEVIEVCLTNQSTQVHEVLEQEVMETTFARASNPVSSGGSAASGAAPSTSPNAPSSASTPPTIVVPGRKGGVFSINLESIVWSDQTATGAASTGKSDGATTDEYTATARKSVLHSVQVRFSLVRDIRAVVRFLMTSNDAAVCTSLLLLLRRLAVSFLDMRFALVSSSVMDCLLYLMHDRRSDADDNEDSKDSHVSIHVRMACVPLFIYLLDWLESIEGRTVWCGLEEHLRLVLNGQGSFSVGFLELMMEFYFDPAWLLGVQHSIIMNDPSKRDSLLFPIAPAASNKSVVAHDNGLEDGIAVTSSTIAATGELTTGIGGLIEWIKMANQFVGKRLQLTWEKRASVIRLTALRSLSNVGAEVRGDSQALVADMFDEGVSGILSLPLKGILPFLPILLGKSTPHFREKVLMDINVKLKTDEDLQQQLLLMKKSWADALLELSLTCSVGVELVDATNGGEDQGDDENCGRAYSVDASKTGEDLVLDTIVSLLCMAMSNPHGWRSFTHLLLALKGIQVKYGSDSGATSVSTFSSLPPLAQVAPHVTQSELYREPLNWTCRVVGIVLQRMARSRTILSRTLAENAQRLLFLVHESLLILPLKPVEVATDKYSWSDAQLFLFNAVLDVCARLVESTHKLHRVGLFPGLQILQLALPYLSAKTMMERVVEVLVQSFQQELTAGSTLRVYESVPTRDVFLRALVDLRRAMVVHKKEELLVLLRRLTLRICTSGSFDEELGVAGLSVHELGGLTEQQAVEVTLDALALAINDTELHEREEVEDMVPYFPIAKELQRPQESPDTDEAEKKYSSVDYADDSERVLWAALEVEENRMLATLRDVTSREKQRAETALSVQREKKQKWTDKLWLKHEFTFRSQNQYASLRLTAPDTLAALQKTLMWRLGLYETPFPSRVRRTVDVDLQHSSTLAIPLEILQSFEGDTEGQASSSTDENLLERVGRVVAQQRGGEIRDITSDEALPASELADTYVPSTDGDKNEYKSDVAVSTDDGKQSSTTSTTSSSKGTALLGQGDQGLDPGAGIAVAPDDQVYASVTCRRVVPEGIVLGRLSLCGKHVAFEPHQEVPDNAQSVGGVSPGTTDFDERSLPSTSVDETAPGLHRCWRWKYTHLVGVYLRRYRLRDSAIEIFLRNGSNHFLDFPLTTKQRRNEFVRVLYSFLPRSTPKQWPGRVIPHLAATTKAWQNRQISNFDYLMALNTFAGRSFNDLTQYPVFPWILSNYEDATWKMCNSQMSEVKELTPEFYASDGSFLRNRNGYGLGKRHDQQAVNDVQLPKWARTPEEFVRIHRAALESEYVSRHLHLWVDLIFGYKQRGRASLQANNVFYYLTYYGVVDLDQVEDPFLRESMELQIAHFGQCPMQLFATPHPPRHAAFRRSALGAPAAPSKPVSGLTSPPVSGGFPGKESSSGPSSNIPRPLSLAFQDFSPIAQEKRRHWSPVATVKPIAQSGIRLLKILPDRVVSVNELGVIEVYYWKLLPKPAPPVAAGSAFSSVTDGQRDSEVDTLLTDLAAASDDDAVNDCPWLLEIVRDDSPFEYVPRIPVFDPVHHDDESRNLQRYSRGFPVGISRNGRVLVSGGARSGALHFRLLDLDNGHVIGKASVVGHSAAVTCLSLDRWSYHSHSQVAVSPSQEDEELLVSGSQDGTLALWRLSRVKPDLLFRLPKVSPRPILILRGHATPLVDCCVSTYLGVVASCTHSVGMVHFLYDEGQVAFVFEPAEQEGELARVRLSVKGYVIAITSVTRIVTESVVISSIVQIFNLSGVLIQSHHLPAEEISDVQVSAEGDLIFLTLVPGIIRICRIEDFVTVQEYISPTPTGSMISAMCLGPKEAVILLASGHEDGTLSLQLLPDASGSVSFLANVRRLLGVSSKLKRVKGTVQHAQTLAMSTIDNAKAVTSTARDIAGEALGEAKVMMRGLFSYLQKG
ncbi:neurobeachin-like protein [Phytophthora infestans T30-4]|uniref:Neurobeachin-like protein n=1 Tax=Phytophthora infestans (strain T30-4) TaxID=403677 RepID=D0NB84_PHYIT|nr:neurobeachin-like protein [Phytophthora infestans T30-4]EEY55313.1 neurobeachin-like protein [Phytophthora infestans T30-4]|eukprot:XP_002903537.1 neurobeachin-like protein [Phytophthora infestans T30-4]